MDLYVFSSKTFENIKIGVQNRKWAVSDLSETVMKTRFRKSRKMVPGSVGLLYCKEIDGFTVPFRIESQPKSADETITGVWAEPWALPFEISPLGSPNRRVARDVARREWMIYDGVPNVTFKTPLGGRYAFNSCKISEDEWRQIIKFLGFRIGEPE